MWAEKILTIQKGMPAKNVTPWMTSRMTTHESVEFVSITTETIVSETTSSSNSSTGRTSALDGAAKELEKRLEIKLEASLEKFERKLSTLMGKIEFACSNAKEKNGLLEQLEELS